MTQVPRPNSFIFSIWRAAPSADPSTDVSAAPAVCFKLLNSMPAFVAPTPSATMPPPTAVRTPPAVFHADSFCFAACIIFPIWELD